MSENIVYKCTVNLIFLNFYTENLYNNIYILCETLY